MQLQRDEGLQEQCQQRDQDGRQNREPVNFNLLVGCVGNRHVIEVGPVPALALPEPGSVRTAAAKLPVSADSRPPFRFLLEFSLPEMQKTWRLA